MADLQVLSNDDEEIDIGLCYDSMPPIVVPLSKRAQEKITLPEGAVGAVFLENSAEELMELFDPQWMCAMITIAYHPGDTIAIMSIKVLH